LYATIDDFLAAIQEVNKLAGLKKLSEDHFDKLSKCGVDYSVTLNNSYFVSSLDNDVFPKEYTKDDFLQPVHSWIPLPET
jgi:hypothetical protein